MDKQRWNDLTEGQKTAALVMVGADVVLKAAAWHFLYHRPKAQIRGPKWAWAVVTTLVGTVGPLAFLVGGMKR